MRNLLITVIALLSLMSCKKENNRGTGQKNNQLAELPPATQTGANTLGFLLNGNAIVSNKLSCIYARNLPLYDTSYFSCTLIGIDSTSTGKQTLGFYLAGVPMLRNNFTIALDNPVNAPLRWYADYNDAPLGTGSMDYQTVPGSPDVITFLKVDTVNKILSGTFSFSATSFYNVTDTVTQGRFDVHYTSN